ncbi:glycoside hydrolase family 2 protein [Curtobacterium sp. ISL-83]|nr:glycoside hydrolase family 2 protein [Curtobacterium sp. ISL-83]
MPTTDGREARLGHRLDLTGSTWTVTPTAGPVPESLAHRFAAPIGATVPGEVHTDLLAAGIIDDPFDGDNEALLAWIGYCEWQYRTTFTWTAGDAVRHDLVADGLDTAATITLNGHEVARTANQHRSYRFDVRPFLVEGTNELVVDLRSPIEYAREQEVVLGARPKVMHHPFNAIRKRASDFGWDWGIDLSTSGIWRPIGIESWSGVRIASVRPLVDVVAGRGVLTAHVDLEWASETHPPTEVTVEVAGGRASRPVTVGETAVTLVVEPDHVDLWWPRGHGEQPLYRVSVRAGDADWSARIGFRTVTLDTTPDADGSPFSIAVNDRPVYVRGANWIPDDALVTRMTPERYRASVTDAADAGMNLLRVWGGGMFESDDFYDVCDELGILVWQDFLFACAAYSEEEPLRSEVEAEAREAVTRLSAHPSLALWNGCNENIWAYVEWGWAKDLVGRTWGEGYYRELLPAIVAELDPTRPYSPGSPFSFLDYAHPNDERNGTMHIWDVWNQRDYADYATHHPRFASEFGFQGPPAWTTLVDVVHDEPLDPYGHQMLVHQKADDGNGKLERGLGAHLPVPTTIEGWHWATQLNQARAIRFAVEHFRSEFPRNTGAIVWQLNDDWPVVSWAAVDHAGIRKPLWYALRDAYQDRLLVFRPREDGGLELVLHNDSDTALAGSVVVERRSADAVEPLATATVDLAAPARGLARVGVPDELATVTDAASEFLVARIGDARAHHWFAEDTDLTLAATREAVDVLVEPVDGGFDVVVTARSVVKDLFLQADRIHRGARVGDGLVTLAPGERARIRVTVPAGTPVPDASTLAFPVLCSAGDVVARAQ